MNYGRTCGECIYCKCRDTKISTSILPSMIEIYCDSPIPPTYSGLVKFDSDFPCFCKYFKEKSNEG